LAAVAAMHKDLTKLGVKMLSISVDSHFVHKVWQEHELPKMVKGGVPFPCYLTPEGTSVRFMAYMMKTLE